MAKGFPSWVDAKTEKVLVNVGAVDRSGMTVFHPLEINSDYTFPRQGGNVPITASLIGNAKCGVPLEVEATLSPVQEGLWLPRDDIFALAPGERTNVVVAVSTGRVASYAATLELIVKIGGYPWAFESWPFTVEVE